MAVRNPLVCLMLTGVFVLGSASFSYSDTAPKQVQIEAKIIEADHKLAEQLFIYVPVNDRDAKGEFAFVITPLENNQSRVEVTSLIYGRGADYRRWVPQNPQLQINEPKITLRPEETFKAYINKTSAATPVASFLFAAIGSQYESAGAKAAASPGTACSGSSHSEKSGGGTSEAIDRVGMAAGLGLLTSQAKGQLEGQKSVFITDTPFLNFTFKTEAFNRDKKQLIIMVTPSLSAMSGEQ